MKNLTKKSPSLSTCLSPWLLDPATVFLNHGSFGACPKPVLDAQQEWRLRLERQPVHFMVRELEPLLAHAASKLASFLNCNPCDLAWVPNATHGINAVLRSLSFEPGDELLVTNQAYNATRNAVEFAAASGGARVVVAQLPFPVNRIEDLVQPILVAASPRTRLAILDHVTSQTAMVLPLERCVRELKTRGVDTLVDGAHAPGMVSLNLRKIGAAYYTGNCHKWLCAPKGAAFLHVSPSVQNRIRPLAISHGANSTRTDLSRFQLEFGWTGTSDPSAWLSVPTALEFMGNLLPGGWPDLMAKNRDLALHARSRIALALGCQPPCPADCVGSMASLPLPPAPSHALPRLPRNEFPLQDSLREKHRIEVPVIAWPSPPHRVVRISAQFYNRPEQYDLLASALVEELRTL